MSEFDAQEGRSIGGHGSRQGRAEAREEGLETSLAVELTNDAANRDVALGGLQARLDRVHGEDGDPHGDTSSGAGGSHGGQTQLARWLPRDGILGAELALDVLVGGKVGGGAGPVAGEGGGAAAEDAADAAFAVELADDVEAAAVLGLLAGGELLLALNLEDDLDALKGGGDHGHGDGGEEARGRDLADGVALGGDGRDGADDLLAEVVAPEGHGD